MTSSSGQSWLASHAETIAQNVVGLIIGFFVLMLFGIPMRTSFTLQGIYFVLAYVRSYTIRRFFNWWHHRKVAA